MNKKTATNVAVLFVINLFVYNVLKSLTGLECRNF